MIRTLHVDIEGGWGGSSRSLYELLRRLDRSRVAPLVAHRQEGPLQTRYAEIGIPTVHVPEIGSFVPRRHKNVRNFVASLPRLRRLGSGAARLAAIADRHQADLIHLNYEGLFLLAERLKRATNLPIACHNRAHLPENVWGRWLVGRMTRSCDQLFFISPQEESRVRSLANGRIPPGEVVWNMAPDPIPRQALSDPPEAVYLGSIDPTKGTDRMLDIAAALNEVGAPPLRLAIYGSARSGSRLLEKMRRRITEDGLAGRIEIRDHTPEPERVLAGALALIRPSRESDPWGRDVIEATAFGVPVLATGIYQGVVESGTTGYLYETFDATAIARQLCLLALEPDLWQRLSDAARCKGERVFSGAEQVATVTAAFERLAARSP